MLESTGASTSPNGVRIRLPIERWEHITTAHTEMEVHYFNVMECVRDPDAIYSENSDELLAVKEIEPGKVIVVCYKENLEARDGFIITAYTTRNIRRIRQRNRIWPT